MPTVASNSAPTQFLQADEQRYAYRRFGNGSRPPLLCLQHFTGTLDNWDPAVTDPLAVDREVILFENAGIGRSTGKVPETIAGMARHAVAFLDAIGDCPAATCSDSRSAEWSRSRWPRIARRSFAG